MNITIRNLQENELDEARRIVKLAFGTFLGLPDPMAFGGDASYPHPRWATDAEASFGAFLDDRLIGSNFAVVWGSLGFFGPLTVHPDHWESKTGSQLMQPIMDTFARRNLTHSGLFTFGQSPKHLHLYQKFGFWPRYLTAIGQKEVGQAAPAVEFSRFSRLPAREKESALSACREVADSLYEGLDLSREIIAIDQHRFGDTVLLQGNDRLAAFAVCHCGPGSEAGSDSCFVKFAAVRPSPTAEQDFRRLLQAVEAFAAEQGLKRVEAGVNTARHEAYRVWLEAGFRPFLQGVAMQRPNEPGYNRPGVFAIDDWR